MTGPASGADARPMVSKPRLNGRAGDEFGPATITHWSQQAGLEELGTYWMRFDETGESDPWTLQYEETVFTVSGQAWIVEDPGPREQVLRAGPGELLVLRRGATVRYGGERGTELLLSISPVRWEEAAERPERTEEQGNGA